MSRRRIYPKTTGWWPYVIKTPNNMYYSGYGGGRNGNTQPKVRFAPSHYKTTALYPYIEQFGWEKLEKIVLTDGLTKEQALHWEDRLICMYTKLGCCINKQRSGYVSNDNEYMKELNKQYRQEHKEKINKYKKQWRKEHKDKEIEQRRKHYQKHCEEIKEKSRLYRQEHLEERRKKNREFMKQYYSTPEGKIYDRVRKYNRCHTPIETPLEAKQKYLETGYIPSYIKSDDFASVQPT